MQTVDHPYLSIFPDLVKNMVEFPDDVYCVNTQDERGILVKIHANRSDLGKIIGKAGDTAKALRSIARVIAMAHNAHISIMIADN